jgi:hypothetical protein
MTSRVLNSSVEGGAGTLSLEAGTRNLVEFADSREISRSSDRFLASAFTRAVEVPQVLNVKVESPKGCGIRVTGIEAGVQASIKELSESRDGQMKWSCDASPSRSPEASRTLKSIEVSILCADAE